MKVHQIISHMKRNRSRLHLRVKDVKKLLEHHGILPEYLDQQQLAEFFKTYYPHFTCGVHVKLNPWQVAILRAYKRPVSYDELLHVHTWWDKFAKLPKRTYPRLDQHDPFLAAKGLLEQEKNIQQIGSIKAGIKNPLTRKHDLLVVVGTATGYEEQLRSVTESHDTVGVNGAGVKVPCDFFYSIHGSYLRKWRHKVPKETKTVCEWWIPGVDSGYGIFNEELVELNQFHYSGNMAMLMGIMMGYPRILLVGCPLSNISTDERLLIHDGKYLEIDTWEKRLLHHMPVIQDHFVKGLRLFPETVERVRSISGGFTQEVLGSSFDREAPIIQKWKEERSKENGEAEAERQTVSKSV